MSFWKWGANNREVLARELELCLTSTQKLKVIKEGWLHKRGKMVKNWKKRYFALFAPGLLIYMANDGSMGSLKDFQVTPGNPKQTRRVALKIIEDAHVLGSVQITPSTTVSGLGDFDGQHFVFSVQSTADSRVLHISADSQATMLKWKDDICSCKVGHSRTTSTTSIRKTTFQGKFDIVSALQREKTESDADDSKIPAVPEDAVPPTSGTTQDVEDSSAYGVYLDASEPDKYHGGADVASAYAGQDSLGALLAQKDTAPTSSAADSDSADVLSSVTEELRQNGDGWNAYYQYALDMDESTPQAALRKYTALSKLARDFTAIAKQYGRTIINELCYDKNARTVAAGDIGGIAGGTKFVVHGVIFKLAHDVKLGDKYLYSGDSGPNEEFAAKAAGNELRGAIHCASMEERNIAVRVPMQALVDYRGFRLTAMPVLPLGKGSLIYGSNNAGKRVHSSDPKFNDIAERVAKQLHVKKHRVKDKELCFGGDVEGHFGDDKRYYMLDLARVFPPEDPAECGRRGRSQRGNGVFFRLLRPELLQKLKATNRTPPLNSDAFSRWGVHCSSVNSPNHQPDACKECTAFNNDNQMVRDATRILLDEVIPAFAEELEDRLAQASPEALRKFAVGPATHEHGINIRHLGYVIKHLSIHSAPAQILVVEMVSRSLKNMLRGHLRTQAYQRDSSEFAMTTSVVRFLNLITGAGPDNATDQFWQGVEEEMKARFGPVKLSGLRLRDIVAPFLTRVVEYVLRMVGLQLAPDCLEPQRTLTPGFEFCAADVLDAPVRVKTHVYLEYAQGKLLAATAGTYQEAIAKEEKQAQTQMSRRNTLVRQRNTTEHERMAGLSARLLRVSGTYYEAALRAQPTWRNIIRESSIAAFDRLCLLEKLEDADRGVLQVVDRAVATGNLDDTQFLVVPLFERLFTEWQRRRTQQGPRARLHCGGAADQTSLVHALELLEQATKVYKSRQVFVGQAHANPLSPLMESVQDAVAYRRVASSLLFALFRSSGVEDLVELSKEPIDNYVRKLMYKRAHVAVEMSKAQVLPLLWEWFFVAAKQHKFELTGLLQELGVDLEALDQNGHTRLLQLITAPQCDIDALRAVLAAGADTTAVDPRGHTAVNLCVVSAKTEALTALLDAGADLEQRDALGMTPLHAAIKANKPAICQILLDRGANKEALLNGETPLILSCVQGSFGVAESLIAAKAQLNARDHRFRTALLRVAAVVSADVRSQSAKLLVSAGVDLTEATEDERNALHVAAEHGHTDVIDIILAAAQEQKIQDAVLNAKDERGRTPARVAAQANQTSALDKLVAGGANLDLLANDQETCLTWAVKEGKKDVVRTLVQRDEVNVNFPNKEGESAILLALAAGSMDLFEILLPRVDPKATASQAGHGRSVNALHVATDLANLQAVKAIVAREWPLEIKNSRQWTAMHNAARKSESRAAVCTDICAILLEAKAEVDPVDDWNRTPLHLAAENKAPALVELLLKHKANPNVVAQYNGTPLHKSAIYAKTPRITRLLLEHGADRTIKDDVGRVAIDWAKGDTKTLLEEFPNTDIGKEEAAPPADAESDAVSEDTKQADDVVGDSNKSSEDTVRLQGSGHQTAMWWLADQKKDRPMLVLSQLAEVPLASVDANTAPHVMLQLSDQKVNADASEAFTDINSDCVDLKKTPTPLWSAVINKNSETVELLVKAKACTTTLMRGIPPLALAVRNGDLATTKALLSDPSAVEQAKSMNNLEVSVSAPKIGSQFTSSSMMHAAACRKFELTKLLLDAGFSPNIKEHDTGNTPLHVAKDGEITKLLLEAKANVNAQNNALETPAHNGSDPEKAKALVDAGADVNIKDSKGRTAAFSMLLNDHKAAEYMLKAPNCDVNAADDDGMTVLALAAALNAEPTLLDLCLAAKADVTAKSPTGFTALHAAAKQCNVNNVKKLLEAKADVNAKHDSGQSAVDYAAAMMSKPTSTQVVDLLLQHKADFGTIFDATRAGKVDHVKEFMELKADPNMLNSDGFSVLHLAAMSRSTAVLKYLLANGANVDVPNKTRKQTPLFFAANEDIARALVEAGASRTHKDVNGRTAVEHITQSEKPSRFFKKNAKPSKVRTYLLSLEEQ